MVTKYDTIGINYNLTRRADPYLVERLHFHLQPKADRLYLDIGCGTGNYTNALQQNGVQMIGIEPSKEMLAKAKQKNKLIKWIQGTSETIPLKNESVNGCIATLTIHHWMNLYNAFKEIYRVLKSVSRLVIFTSTPKQMEGYWLNHYFPKMLQNSMGQMPSYANVEENLLKNGFKISNLEPYSVKSDLQDFFLYSGKERPELYLKPQIRHGISSFSSLSNKEEIEQGLLELQDDIASGKINTIIEHHKNDGGDYVFIVAEK
ncbi:MAG: class I SAM-dependent methyltransferase [Gelidibacter sp.]